MTLSEHLERARALARRHGHARIAAVHVLLSLSNVVAVQMHMATLGYSLKRLERHMRGALAAEPASRGGGEPVIDMALEPVLANAVMELALFEALVAPFAAQLQFDDAPLRRFAEEANAAAAATGHERPLVEHALYVLARRATDEGRFADALERLGYARRDFRHHMAERIQVVADSTPMSSFAELRDRAIAHANATMNVALTTDAFVVDLLRVSSTRRALEAVGVSHPSLLFSYVHGEPPAPLAMIAAPADIVLYADPFTPPATIADLLARYFGQAADAAMTLAISLRKQGHQALRVNDARAAAPAVASVRAECAELGVPLRIELRAIPVGGKGTGGLPSF